MTDMLSTITNPLAQFRDEHSAKIEELSKTLDPSNLQQVTEVRMEWQKITMAMQLHSAIMSRLEKAIDSMVQKM